MNACLITWSPVGERAEQTVLNRIAAILPSRTSENDIIWTMQLLAHNHAAWNPGHEDVYVSDQLIFAKSNGRLPVGKLGFWRYLLGGNPSLHARMAIKVELSEDNDAQILDWEEEVYPNINISEDMPEQLQNLRPFPRSRWRFTAATNKIERLLGENP